MPDIQNTKSPGAYSANKLPERLFSGKIQEVGFFLTSLSWIWQVWGGKQVTTIYKWDLWVTYPHHCLIESVHPPFENTSAQLAILLVAAKRSQQIFMAHKRQY